MANTPKKKWPYKNIPVKDEVHERVRLIAEANFRGIGDQVAFWAAADCPHPVEMREEKKVQVALMEDGKLSEDSSVRVFYCNQCQHHVVISDEDGVGKKFEALIS